MLVCCICRWFFSIGGRFGVLVWFSRLVLFFWCWMCCSILSVGFLYVGLVSVSVVWVCCLVLVVGMVSMCVNSLLL